MRELCTERTPMGFAGQVVASDGTTAPKLLDFPVTEDAFRRLEEAAELPSESHLEIQMRVEARKAENEAEKARCAKTLLARYRRKAEHFRKATIGYALGWGTVGFVLGIVLAVSQVLDKHGPTVTIHGTIGACVLYAISGTLFSVLFAWLGYTHASDRAGEFSEAAEWQAEVLAQAEENKIYHLEMAESYANALRHRQYAWLFNEQN